MQIDWWTLGLQAINFLVLVWLLKRFLYRPVREVLAERRARSDRALADAEAKQAEAEAVRQRYEQDRAALAQARRDLEAQVHREAQDEAERIRQAAREEAAETQKAAAAAAAEERARALEATRREVAAMAADLAAGLLRGNGETGAGPEAVRAVDVFLAALPDARRTELRDEARAGGEPVEVATAAPLSVADRAAWADALHGWFGDGVRADFATDPALLGGVVLRLPRAELDFTWARQLREAEARMLGGQDAPRA